MSEDAIKIIGECEIAKLSLNAGDVLVVKCASALHFEARHRALTHFRELLPPECKVIIIDESIELSVMTRSEIATKDA